MIVTGFLTGNILL